MINLHWLPHWKTYAIRHNGRVIGMIRCAPPLPFRAERKELVQRYVRHLNLAVERSVLDAEDQVMALREDQQGLGLSRRQPEAQARVAQQR